MNRQKVIDIINNELECIKRAESCDKDCGKCDLVMNADDIVAALNAAVEALDYLDKNKPAIDLINAFAESFNYDPANSLAQQWIPCDENMPQIAGNYLITHDNMEVDESFYMPAEEMAGQAYWDYFNVVAWMPLPPAYKE